ncbi:MAG: lysophospholipid acyltransferase family protein [Deltaproteobacteria bacterium]|nr:lysophospholipid acyltransferase family protein [Deltaproteobacteria bacterium]
MPGLEATTAPAEGRWSSRSVGSRLQHGIFYALVRLGGRRAAYALLYPVVAYYALASGAARRRACHYLSRRFPDHRGARRLGDTFRLLLDLGKVLVDRAVVGILGPDELGVRLDGREELLAALGEGRGLILVTAHVGCWQVAMAALGFLGKPVSMLMHREDGDVDRQYFEHAGLPCPYRVIDPRGYLGGALEMLQVLKAGEVLCVMGDRVMGSQRNVLRVPFLGEEAPFPFSAFKLAASTRAPVAVLLSHKSGPASYVLEAGPILRLPEGLGRRDEDLRPYVTQFVEVLERFTAKHPFQFFNFYDMWAGA